jgi:hypothetical protein
MIGGGRCWVELEEVERVRGGGPEGGGTNFPGIEAFSHFTSVLELGEAERLQSLTSRELRTMILDILYPAIQ